MLKDYSNTPLIVYQFCPFFRGWLHSISLISVLQSCGHTWIHNSVSDFRFQTPTGHLRSLEIRGQDIHRHPQHPASGLLQTQPLSLKNPVICQYSLSDSTKSGTSWWVTSTWLIQAVLSHMRPIGDSFLTNQALIGWKPSGVTSGSHSESLWVIVSQREPSSTFGKLLRDSFPHSINR